MNKRPTTKRRMRFESLEKRRLLHGDSWVITTESCRLVIDVPVVVEAPTVEHETPPTQAPPPPVEIASPVIAPRRVELERLGVLVGGRIYPDILVPSLAADPNAYGAAPLSTPAWHYFRDEVIHPEGMTSGEHFNSLSSIEFLAIWQTAHSEGAISEDLAIRDYLDRTVGRPGTKNYLPHPSLTAGSNRWTEDFGMAPEDFPLSFSPGR